VFITREASAADQLTDRRTIPRTREANVAGGSAEKLSPENR
jgi:hypothetical protein